MSNTVFGSQGILFFFLFLDTFRIQYRLCLETSKTSKSLEYGKLKLYYPDDPPSPGQVIQNLDLYSTHFLIFTRHNGQTLEIRCLVSQYLPQMSNLTTLRGGGITSGADGDIK